MKLFRIKLLKKTIFLGAIIMALLVINKPVVFGNKIIASKIGIASYYSNNLHGRKTANGEIYNKNKFTAAHRKMKFGTKLIVTNLNNNKSVKVTINDRGPFVKKRIIDLSYAAAKKIGLIKKGIAKVRIDVIK